jgi:hypothetical protein
MSTIQTTARHADLGDLVTLLQGQRELQLDAVVPGHLINSHGAILHIPGMDTATPDSVDALLAEADQAPKVGRFLPTSIMDGQIGEKLGIPVAYLRKLRIERPDLYDANVNGWLHGDGGDAAPDGRKFLIRSFADAEGGVGIGRALLAQNYKPVDNLDLLLTVLDVIRAEAIDVRIDTCDLSERRMCVRVWAPDRAVPAAGLLGGYRSPVPGLELDAKTRAYIDRLAQTYSADHLGWDASKGETPPVAFAGFEITNGETGGSALQIARRVVLALCKNGLKITAESLRKVHLGGKLEEGVVRWSSQTQQANLELVRAQAADYVRAALDVDATRAVIEGIEAKASTAVADPATTIEVIAKELSFSEETAKTVLDHFIRGGQMTAGGILNAVTSTAQVIADPDTAYDVEASALRALDLAVAAAKS